MPGFSPSNQSLGAMSYLGIGNNSASKSAPTQDSGQIPFKDAANPSPQNPTPPPNQLINTSTQSRTQTAQASSDLDAALAKISGAPTQLNPNPTSTPDTNIDPSTGLSANDPIISGLNTISANSDAATKSLIASTVASYQTQRNAVTSQYENYKRGLQQLGIESGAAQSTPDLLAGHIVQAGNDELSKINDLQAKEAKALMDAQNAKTTNDFKTLQEKMAYVKQVQTEKATAIKNMYDTINNTNKALAVETHADLFDAFSTLSTSDDKQAFINQVAKNYNVSPLAVVTALNDEQAKRTTANLKTQNTQSIIANRGGKAGSGKISAAQIAQGQNALNQGIDPSTGQKIGNPKGSDGFYDPSVYAKAFSDWPGSAKAFVAAFPIVGGINPSSYSILPPALQALLPKTKASGRSS